MDYRKALFSAASVLALTAAAGLPAGASTGQTNSPQGEPAGLLSQAVNEDPLFELVRRTNGDFSAEAIEGAIVQMFDNPSAEQVQAFPQFLTGIAGLGVTSDALALAKDLLIAIAGDNDAVVAQLNSGPAAVHLAQYRPRDPQQTGQGGGGGGGGYGG
jgi:hypothetical protein